MLSFLLLISSVALLMHPARLTSEAVGISELIHDVTCIRGSYTTAFPRGYLPLGTVDPDYVSNTKQLNSKGFVWWPYMIPCFKCGNPAKQAKDLIAAADIPNNIVTIYLDAGQKWGTDLDRNRAFILGLITEIVNEQHVPVILASKYSFEKILGKGWTELASLPLYYVSPNGKKSCGDFVAFGGWTKPDGKLYLSDSQVCGNKLDMIMLCGSSEPEQQSVTMAD